MSLAQLAQFAAKTNNAKAPSKAVHTLSVEDARERVIIKDGNKKANEDGTQALTLVLGKYVLSLDAVAPKATRINATAEQVEEFTATLQAAIDDGTFDEAIVVAQAKSKATSEKPRVTAAPEAVNLDELESEGESEEVVDLSDDDLG